MPVLPREGEAVSNPSTSTLCRGSRLEEGELIVLLVRLQLRMAALQLVQHVEEEQHRQVTPEQVPVQSVGDPTVRRAGE